MRGKPDIRLAGGLIGGLALALAGCSAWNQPATGPNLRYDYQDGEYEVAGPEDKLRYDYMEDEFEYADPGADLEYNYMVDRYEYP